MARLVITADIHGSLRTWDKIKALVKQGDSLAIAGDLFDTVYGSKGNDDFRPDIIKKDFRSLPFRTYYVYGNCDREDYFKGHGFQCDFDFNGHAILMNHGHQKLPDLTNYQIIIEGHSHRPRLDSIMGKIFLNPGSPNHPRSEYPSYALLENHRIRIMDFTKNKVISELDIS
ncbi:MAG: YfcE family phosphodiesterase [Proteobacteria bacterium]|nr:YfcE family phosphodiesterase [Pseudomonadota bacterium]